MSTVIAAARRYLGRPFRHRARGPRYFDCRGLIWRSYLDCGTDLPCPDDYGREPHAPRFRAAVELALGPAVTGALQVADVVTLRTLNHPHHLAFIGDYPGGLSLIHASGEHGRVVEHRLSDDYLARIVSIHRRPL